MRQFENGDFVKTPAGRIARVDCYFKKNKDGDAERAGLTYADTGEQVTLPPSMLQMYDGPLPDYAKERKMRADSWEPTRIFGTIADAPPPVLNPVEQILLMSGAVKEKIQGQAGGMARSRTRKNGKPS